MKTYVRKRYTFEASHNLLNYDGKCSRLHGHSYKLELTFSREDDILNEQYMIIDFNDIDKAVKPLIERYDHNYLNDFFKQPTAEIIAQSIYTEICTMITSLYSGVKLCKVQLWETEKCSAIVTS